MRIITSAQSFGNGPASKLVTLAKQLHGNADYCVDFLGDDIALTYATQNRTYFNLIQKFEGANPNPADYDMVVSVMNPYLVVWAYINNLPALYIDSLYWFWSWDEQRFDEIEALVTTVKASATYEQAHAILGKLGPHELQYAAHSMSTLSLVQSFSHNMQHKGDPYRDSLAVTLVGPIIDASRQKDTLRDSVVISLSGLISPLNREDEAWRYATLIMNLLQDFINELPENIQIYLTGSPSVVRGIKVGNERVRVVAFNNDEFLDILNKTLLLFVPSGITTIYEAANYGTPIFFLPEQHDGHYKNYLRLTNQLHYRDTFPELLLNTRLIRDEQRDPDEEIEAIKQLINDIGSDSTHSMAQEWKKTIRDIALPIVTSPIVRNKLVEQQQVVVHELSGGIVNLEPYLHQIWTMSKELQPSGHQEKRLRSINNARNHWLR